MVDQTVVKTRGVVKSPFWSLLRPQGEVKFPIRDFAMQFLDFLLVFATHSKILN